MLDALTAFVKTRVPDHLQELWRPDMETQINFPGDKRYRLPKGGNTGEPWINDHDYHPPMESMQSLGVTGWQWPDGQSLFTTIDLDSIVTHEGGHDQERLDAVVRKIMLVPAAEVIRSKSGYGYHVRLYFDPDRLPRTATREEHINVSRKAMRWLANEVGEDLPDIADCCGVVAWIYHVDRGEDGFKVLKQSTAFIPDDFALTLPKETAEQKQFFDEAAEKLPSTPKHEELVKYLTDRGWGEMKGDMLVTHTRHLTLAAEDKQLGIVGSFTTLATGKDGPSDRNCFCYPAEAGSWRVIRYGKGAKEHSSWWKTTNGFTATWFNRGKDAKGDPAATVFNLGMEDELFRDPFGNGYVTTEIGGIKETLPINDSRYRYSLRIRYTSKTGRIVGADHLKNALEQLQAEAAQPSRREYPVAVRIAAHGDKLYIDLANRERQILEVSASGYRIAENPPVRFFRPQGQLPLPMPLPGGTKNDLLGYVNVDTEDVPLLLALMVGVFHPSGPYCVGQIVGEQGSAKTWLSRFIHDFCDPHAATGNVIPENARDMLIVAKSRWLLSFDNLSKLPKKLSDLLAMLVTGSAFSSRKLYTNDEQAMTIAKRPVILTSIANVVEASDLLDRTLTLCLPTIPQEKRRTEFDLSQSLRREGVRGRIFGYLLGGVVSALANHSTVKLPYTPRMSDFITWATAAESGLGLEPGSILAAFVRCQTEQSGDVADSQFSQKVIAVCGQGFKGTAHELASRMSLGLSGQQTSNHLRECAPDLRRNNCIVEFRRSNGKRLIELATKNKAAA